MRSWRLTQRQAVNANTVVVQGNNSSLHEVFLSQADDGKDCICQSFNVDVRYSDVEKRGRSRSADGEYGSEILVKADYDGSSSSRLGEDLLIGCPRIHDLGNPNDRVPMGSESFDHMARDIDIGQEFHAAGGSSSTRPEASHAAYRRHSLTSSTSSSGNSSIISAGLLPSARYLNTTDTGIRKPRTQGCPWHTVGSIVIRLIVGSMLSMIPDFTTKSNPPCRVLPGWPTMPSFGRLGSL